MAYATAYGNLLYDQKPFEYQPDQLASQVAQVKNQLFDQAYRNIESMKTNVLNMNLLNKDAQNKVNEYNQKINNFFADKKLAQMDLADNDIASNLTNIFSEIGGDSEIKKHKQKTDEFLKLNNFWNEAAKNPAKTGYSKENHEVWLNENLDEYINEKSSDALNVSSGAFMPYYDYSKDIKNLSSLLKFDGSKFEVIDPKNPGLKETIEVSQLTPQKINTLLRSGLSQQAITQIQTEQKANFYRAYRNLGDNAKQDFVGNLYHNLEQQSKQNSNKIQSDINVLEGRLKMIKDSDEAENVKKQIESLTTQKDNSVWNESLSEFSTLPKKVLAQYYANFMSQNKLQGFSDALAYKIEKRASSLNQPYWKQLEYNQSIQKFNYDVQKDQRDFEYTQQHDLAKLELEQEKLNTSPNKKSSSFFGESIPGDYVQPVGKPEDFYNAVISLDKEIEKKSKVVDVKNLTIDDIKRIYQNPNDELSELRPIIMRFVTMNGANDNSFGQALESLNQNIKNGVFDDQKNTNAAEVENLISKKNDAWNLAAVEFSKIYKDFLGIENNPQGPLKQALIDRLKRDKNALKEFTELMGQKLLNNSSNAKKLGYTILADESHKENRGYILSLPFVDDDNNKAVLSSDNIDWNSVKTDGDYIYANTSEKKDGATTVKSFKTPLPDKYKQELSDDKQDSFLINKKATRFFNGYRIDFVLDGTSIFYQIKKDDKLIDSNLNKVPMNTDNLNVAYSSIVSELKKLQ